MTIDWDRVLSRTVHDVRTQVRNGRTSLQLLARELPEISADASSRLAAAGESQRNLDGLTMRLERLLEAARADKAELWADLQELEVLLLAAKLDQGAALAEAHAEIAMPRVPKLRLPAKLQSVFAELLGNALRHRRPEQPLRVSVDARQTDAHAVRVCIRDNGMGWDPAYTGRLFQPFERLRSGGDGFGLGLATCRLLVEAAGGRIDGEPVPPGAAFTVEMPVVSS